ncbi:MAG: hypothetical protein F6K41_12210 [Symploca sp. SIO3E6]|nr:hypothetical protein [Caldora sp. SIO3E6]
MQQTFTGQSFTSCLLPPASCLLPPAFCLLLYNDNLMWLVLSKSTFWRRILDNGNCHCHR